MHYDSTIAPMWSTTAVRGAPAHTPSDWATTWATFTPGFSPAHWQQEAYWSEARWPREPWSGANTTQHNEWATEREERRQAEERRKAERQEKRKKRMLTELPQKLETTLNRIYELRYAIGKAEEQVHATKEVIDRTMIQDDNQPFWNRVYEEGVRLNALRSECAGHMTEYTKLYRTLRRLDQKLGDEFKETYQRLRKHARTKENGRSQSGSADFGNQTSSQEQEYHAGQEEQTYQEFVNHTDPSPTEGSHSSSAPANHPPSSDSPRTTATLLEGDSMLANDQASSNPHIDFNQAQNTNNGNNDGLDSEEEVILIQIRRSHEQHKDIEREFWSIMQGDDYMCSYCGIVGVVVQCPRHHECGLVACEHCKNSR